MPRQLIIDCHCHAGPGDGLTGPWNTRASLTDFLRWSRSAGIARTNLFAAFHTDYAIANRHVARVVAAYPDRFYGFAFIHPRRDAGRVFDMVRTAVQRYHFCGIKVHRFDARLTREVCDAARAFGLPVLYDVVGEAAQVELFATEYPTVDFIIPHLGSFADDWRAQVAMIDHLERHPNVYADTSGVRRFDILLQALRRAGPEKLLFGSDGPWLHPGVELAKVKALPLSAVGFQQICSRNFLKLITNVRRRPTKPLEQRIVAIGSAGASRRRICAEAFSGGLPIASSRRPVRP